MSVPPGAGKSVTISLRKNGLEIGYSVIAGNSIVGFIMIDHALVQTDILSVHTYSLDPGAATDVTTMVQIRNA